MNRRDGLKPQHGPYMPALAPLFLMYRDYLRERELELAYARHQMAVAQQNWAEAILPSPSPFR